jgi:CheY-like chemotaxis protein
VRTIRADRALAPTKTIVLSSPLAVAAVAAMAPPGLVTKPAGQERLYREITLALAAADSGAGSGVPQRSERAGGRGRVLVAEDNAVNQLVAVRLLEQRGFLVDVASDGREAIALHAKNVYDAILMDCQMPEINGYEASREIRRREGLKRHTPIIAMTASTLPEDRDRCIAAGMDDHIGKPVRPSALDHLLARTMAGEA